MKPNPKVIDISSDSSSDSTFDIPQIQRAYYYLDEGPSEFYPPPYSSEETKEVGETPIPLSVVLPDFTPVTAFLTSEMERVCADMRKISVPVEPQSSQRTKGPLKVILGLAAPKLWNKDMQSIGVHKRMPDSKDMGKGKRKME
jgi:hypothetical protein